MPRRRDSPDPTFINEEVPMLDIHTPDPLNMRVWLMLAVLGAFLCLLGLYNFLT